MSDDCDACDDRRSQCFEFTALRVSSKLLSLVVELPNFSSKLFSVALNDCVTPCCVIATLSVTLFGGATRITTVSSTETLFALSTLSVTTVVAFFVTFTVGVTLLDERVAFSPDLDPPEKTFAAYDTGESLENDFDKIQDNSGS